MTDWTSGYVADIAYTFGYYRELNPLAIRIAFLNAGLAFPQFGAACELGFGQGISTNIHAAASVTEWSGTDFNPTQAGFADELASIAGSGARLFDQSFAEYAARSDLPDFDYIGLHGIWSWISDENRAVIVDFIRRKLKVGGVVYISYNTQPGWAAMAPMRDLLAEHAEVMGAPGQGIVSRIDGALAFADQFLAADPTYAKANPLVADRLNGIKEQNRNYLAHEFFNRDWDPMSFSAMRGWLAPAKLSFACSANYLDYVDSLNLTPAQQALIREIPDEMFRQTVRDFMVNQQFRKDYWVKGPRKLSSFDLQELSLAQTIMLLTDRHDITMKVSGALGESSLSEAVYNPVLDALADHHPRTLGQLFPLVAEKGVSFGQLVQAVMILIGAGHVLAVQDAAAVAKARKHTDKLNAHLTLMARGGEGIAYLASPVTGGGVPVSRISKLFMLSLGQGRKLPAHWVQDAWQALVAQGQKLLKNGVILDSEAENLAELLAQAKAFETNELPALKALQVI
ncbi:MAG: class I SAM-dependent methyltransferase [Pseudomonadota bacterium]